MKNQNGGAGLFLGIVGVCGLFTAIGGERWIKSDPELLNEFRQCQSRDTSFLNNIGCATLTLLPGDANGVSFDTPPHIRKAVQITDRYYNGTLTPDEELKFSACIQAATAGQDPNDYNFYRNTKNAILSNIVDQLSGKFCVNTHNTATIENPARG